MKNSFRFFKNPECDHFPCHETSETDDFNCLFCYCPLYHFDDCGGNHTFTDNGLKNCSRCLLPHRANGYEYIIGVISKKAQLL